MKEQKFAVGDRVELVSLHVEDGGRLTPCKSNTIGNCGEVVEGTYCIFEGWVVVRWDNGGKDPYHYSNLKLLPPKQPKVFSGEEINTSNRTLDTILPLIGKGEVFLDEGCETPLTLQGLCDGKLYEKVEVTLPELPWDYINPDLVAFAKDEDGALYGHKGRPMKIFGEWEDGTRIVCCPSTKVSTTIFTHLFKDIPWDKSLVQRPTSKEEVLSYDHTIR